MQQTGDGGGNGLSVTVAVGAAASALAALRAAFAAKELEKKGDRADGAAREVPGEGSGRALRPIDATRRRSAAPRSRQSWARRTGLDAGSGLRAYGTG